MKSPITYKRLLEKVPGLPKELNVGPMSKCKGTTEVTPTSHLMPDDVNFAAWTGIPLAMVAGTGKEYALALAVPLSSLGVLAVYGLCAINLYFVHKQDADVEAGKLDAAARIPIVGQITNFVLRFFPILLINFFGQDLITALVNALPVQVTDILQIIANMLPLVGFMLLMRMICKRDVDLILFCVGFALMSVLKLGMVTIVIFALGIACLDYRGTNAAAAPRGVSRHGKRHHHRGPGDGRRQEAQQERHSPRVLGLDVLQPVRAELREDAGSGHHQDAG